MKHIKFTEKNSIENLNNENDVAPVRGKPFNNLIDDYDVINPSDGELVGDNLTVDTITEGTSGGGVIPDGVKLKDGEITHAVSGIFNGMPLVNGSKPATWITYFEDFIVGGSVADDELGSESNPSGGMFSEVANCGQYLVSLVTAGELVEPCMLSTTDGAGGWIDVLTVATQDHPVNVQANGNPWMLEVGKKLYFETKIMVEDVDQCDWFIGLAIANTDLLSSGVGAVDDIIGFVGLHTTAIQFIANADGSDSINATAGTIADSSGVTTAQIAAEAKTLAFAWDGVDTISYYIDGTLVSVVDTASKINKDEAMKVSFLCDNTEGASTERLWIDYIYVAQER